MTAFEILLNTFYDTIEENEPLTDNRKEPETSRDLFDVIRSFVNVSFDNGHNLSYKRLIDELTLKGANLMRSSTHEDWSRVKMVFLQNDLHILKRDIFCSCNIPCKPSGKGISSTGWIKYFG